jgi:hypothetical protein
VCRLADRAGWSGGLLGGVALIDRPGEALEELAAWPGHLLVAVDYAETRPDLVAGLLLRLYHRTGGARVRVVLVVRQALTKRQLEDLFATGDAREELVGVLRRAELVRLDSDEHELDRAELFEQALAAFVGRVGAVRPTASTPRLRADHFGRPLMVLAAALLVAWTPGTDIGALSDDELAAEVLNRHEAQYWDHWNRHLGVGLDRGDQRRLVAVATLLGAVTEDEASTVVRLVPGFRATGDERVRAIARWLSRLYGSGRLDTRPAIAPLEPDFLAEVLVATELTALPELIGDAFDAASDRQLARALLVLSRAVEGRDQLIDPTRTALNERLSGLFRRLAAQQDRDAELVAGIRLALRSVRPFAGAITAISELPEASTALAPLAAEVTLLAVEALRTLAEANPDRYLPNLASALNKLSNALSDLGRRGEALTACQEAVELRRTLAEANPDRYLSDLARSLNNLSVVLSNLGRRGEALRAIQEAVEHHRTLAEANPDRYLPDLAMSLINLSNAVGDLGRPGEALTAIQEAVELRRTLAEANPDRYLPDLAGALNNLAGRLHGLGRRGEALTACQEAVELRRTLAEANPDRYLPDLAMSLNNLSVTLSDLGRLREALTASQEAVDHYRTLAEANPDRYLPDLATSLNNLSSGLSDLGRSSEAAQCFAELLGDHSTDGRATGTLLLARARWHRNNSDLLSAIDDAWKGAQQLDESEDLLRRGEARSLLRSLRREDQAAFNRAWAERIRIEQPPWLRHHDHNEQLGDLLTDWIGTTTWDDSQSFLAAHSAGLLTDQAEAALEHLVDSNPGRPELLQHLGILQDARWHGVEAAYGALHESLLWELQTERLTAWVQTPSWDKSRSFLEEHTADLMTDQAEGVLQTLADHHPEALTLITHLGLLVLCRNDGIAEAYALLEDSERLRHSTDALTAQDDPLRALAQARLRAGLVSDDGDAHFAHAVAALAAGRPDEAERAIVRSADALAWWERGAHARRLAELAGTRADLAEGLTRLQTLLTNPTIPTA